jgi:hypothetical protein
MGGLIFVGLIAVAIWLFEWPSWGDDLDVYIGWCATEVRAPGECKQWSELYKPVTFTVSKDTQQVLVQHPGYPPRKLLRCAVRDRSNWACEDHEQPVPEIYFRTSMVDGRFAKDMLGSSVTWGLLSPSSPANAVTQVQQLPKWKWLWLHYVDKVRVTESALDWP